jgi:IclR family transcriptional regulator, acetate operon repressor
MAVIAVRPSAANPGTGPRSLARLLGLFAALAAARDGMSLAELSKYLRSPKSSLLNLLRPLVLENYLSYEGARYRLGVAVFRLASNITSAWDLTGAMRGLLRDLAVRSGESAYLGVLDADGEHVVVIDAIESANTVRFSTAAGGRNPLYATAAGKVLLAYGETEWQKSYLAAARLAPLTANTKTSRQALRDELTLVRERGLCISIGELVADSASIAAPVLGVDGKTIAVLAIGAPLGRLQPRLAELEPLIRQIAGRASGNPRAVRDAVPSL